MMEHNFGEKKTERIKGVEYEVWQTPKYLEAKKKAIELIESKEYKDILVDGDFWILMNKINDKTMAYTGLIISHQACVKINDVLPQAKKFKPNCYKCERETYRDGLLATYCDEDIVEYGEVNEVNCKNDYPYAMVLKRCFDRVVLKKSGIAQWGIYSDSEAEEFKERFEPKPELISNDQWKMLNVLYTKEEIKAKYAELGITNGKQMLKEDADKLIKAKSISNEEATKEKAFF